jgi:hypothetical protein
MEVKMKCVVFAFVALAATTAIAAAADLARRAPYYPASAPVYAPLFSWTGFYIGINGGGGFGSSNWDLTGSRTVSGGLVGGTVGYNYQFGQAVAGIEGDVDWSGINGSTSNNVCPFGCKTSNSWLATVRGRLGYAADSFMPYVTGGVRQYPGIDAKLSANQRRQRRLDAWRRAGSGAGGELDGQGRVSLCQSRHLQLRIKLRCRTHYRQRFVPHQHLARWCEL